MIDRVVKVLDLIGLSRTTFSNEAARYAQVEAFVWCVCGGLVFMIAALLCALCIHQATRDTTPSDDKSMYSWFAFLMGVLSFASLVTAAIWLPSLMAPLYTAVLDLSK